MIQGSKEWFIARMGKFTGSEVGKLMQTGRGKDFSETAMAYIYAVAAERNLSENILTDDVLYDIYADYMNRTSKEMRFGSEREAEAADCFSDEYNVPLMECGFIEADTINNFGSSPDRITIDGIPVELKVPTPQTFMRYASEAKTMEQLKKVNPIYYYQCLSHMIATGSDMCFFAVYSPFLKKKIHIIELEENSDIDALKERINKADNLILTL